MPDDRLLLSFREWEAAKTNIFKKAQDAQNVLVKKEEQFESVENAKIIKTFNALRDKAILLGM